jgi:hypothetical protein
MIVRSNVDKPIPRFSLMLRSLAVTMSVSCSEWTRSLGYSVSSDCFQIAVGAILSPIQTRAIVLELEDMHREAIHKLSNQPRHRADPLILPNPDLISRGALDIYPLILRAAPFATPVRNALASPTPHDRRRIHQLPSKAESSGRYLRPKLVPCPITNPIMNWSD